MANTPESISHIQIGQDVHPIDAVTLDGKEASAFQVSGLVDHIDSTSDDDHYPSAKCVYDIIGDLERRLSNI